MLFLYRFLVQLSLQLFIELPLLLIGAFLLLLLLPFYKQTKLPSLLKWFDNADIYAETGRDSSTYMQVIAQGWWARYCWLAWRNPLNYYSYNVTGVTWVVPTQWLVDTSTYQEVSINNKIYYQYTITYKYLLIRFGWKIDKNNKLNSTSEKVFVIKPII